MMMILIVVGIVLMLIPMMMISTVIALMLIPILMISTVVVIALMLIPTVVVVMKFLTFNRERSGEPKVGKLAVALKF